MRKLLLWTLVSMLGIALQGQDCTNLEVTVIEDSTLCSPATVVLNTQINGDFIDLAWSPAAGLSDSTVLSPAATVNSDISYTIRVRSLGDDNLIFNGDFEQGDTGFSSDYIYATGGGVGPLSNEGQYAIADNAGDTHNQFANCSDNTGGGNMMVVNASGETNNLWCQTIMVNQNSEYDFSAFVTSVTSQNPAQLQFSINGALLGSQFNASSATCNWQGFNAGWESGNSTMAEICIVNVNLTPAGNDFALDDIVFREICETAETVNLSLANLDASFSIAPSFCQNEAAFPFNQLLEATATTGGEWLIDNQLVAGPDFIAADINAGTHVLTYRVTEGSCVESSSAGFQIVAFNSAGMGTNGPFSLCGESDVLNLSTLVSGESLGGSYIQVDGPDAGSAFDANTATLDPSGLTTAGIYRFAYISLANGPCPSDTAFIEVSVGESPLADAGEDTSIDCISTTTMIGDPGADPSLVYDWVLNGNSIGINQSSLSVDEAGTYNLIVTDPQTGCIGIDEVIVTDNINEISARLVSTDIGCAGDNGQIEVTDATGGLSPYLYGIDGGALQDNPVFGGLAAGDYEIIVQDAAGCQVILNSSIIESGTAEVNITAIGNTTIRPGDSLILEAQIIGADIANISWSPDIDCAGCTSVTVGPFTNTRYSVTVTTIDGCDVTAFIDILVLESSIAYFPNAFSPNADGVNDVFFVQATEIVAQVSSFRVFDRWGGLVFETLDQPANNSSFGWTGRKDGRLLQPGTYVYVVELLLLNNETRQFAGEINLLR